MPYRKMRTPRNHPALRAQSSSVRTLLIQTADPAVMARLNRGRVKFERRKSCQSTALLALLCGVAGEEELYVLLTFFSLYKWSLYRQLVTPTTLPGLLPLHDLYEVIGGFDFYELFRFEKVHFKQLLRELDLPRILYISRGGYGTIKVQSRYALAVTLWRLSAPTTLLRDRIFWGLPGTLICEIFNLTVELIIVRWGHVVDQLQVDAILPKIEIFCQAISDAGAPLPRRWGFIDGTVRKITRPFRWQRVFYNGWKRAHALKYQAVDSPHCIIRQLWGPMLGRRHDVTLLGQSGLLTCLQEWFNDEEGNPYYIYGDPAYQISPWLMAPFKGVMTAAQESFNASMSSCRVTVEWGFGKIVALWPYVDFIKKQQVGLSASGLGKQYAVAGILTNCHSCFYGNSTSKYFGVPTPSLRSYLRSQG